MCTLLTTTLRCVHVTHYSLTHDTHCLVCTSLTTTLSCAPLLSLSHTTHTASCAPDCTSRTTLPHCYSHPLLLSPTTTLTPSLPSVTTALTQYYSHPLTTLTHHYSHSLLLPSPSTILTLYYSHSLLYSLTISLLSHTTLTHCYYSHPLLLSLATTLTSLQWLPPLSLTTTITRYYSRYSHLRSRYSLTTLSFNLILDRITCTHTRQTDRYTHTHTHTPRGGNATTHCACCVFAARTCM